MGPAQARVGASHGTREERQPRHAVANAELLSGTPCGCGSRTAWALGAHPQPCLPAQACGPGCTCTLGGASVVGDKLGADEVGAQLAHVRGAVPRHGVLVHLEKGVREGRVGGGVVWRWWWWVVVWGGVWGWCGVV